MDVTPVELNKVFNHPVHPSVWVCHRQPRHPNTLRVLDPESSHQHSLPAPRVFFCITNLAIRTHSGSLTRSPVVNAFFPLLKSLFRIANLVTILYSRPPPSSILFSPLNHLLPYLQRSHLSPQRLDGRLTRRSAPKLSGGCRDRRSAGRATASDLHLPLVLWVHEISLRSVASAPRFRNPLPSSNLLAPLSILYSMFHATGIPNSITLSSFSCSYLYKSHLVCFSCLLPVIFCHPKTPAYRTPIHFISSLSFRFFPILVGSFLVVRRRQNIF